MSRRVSVRIAPIILLIALCVAGVSAFRGAGRWLIREDPLEPADVIAVLSGGMPWRAEEAARIFRLGDGREIWLSQPAAPRRELASMRIPYFGEEYFNREVLVRNGVPDAAVRVLPDTIVDTQDEVEEVARKMRRERRTGVIFVTSPQHTRRVRALWRKLVGENLRAIVRAARQDPFDADHWWRNTQDTYSVVREMMGLANAWLGFPVRPHSR